MRKVIQFILSLRIESLEDLLNKTVKDEDNNEYIALNGQHVKNDNYNPQDKDVQKLIDEFYSAYLADFNVLQQNFKQKNSNLKKPYGADDQAHDVFYSLYELDYSEEQLKKISTKLKAVGEILAKRGNGNEVSFVHASVSLHVDYLIKVYPNIDAVIKASQSDDSNPRAFHQVLPEVVASATKKLENNEDNKAVEEFNTFKAVITDLKVLNDSNEMIIALQKKYAELKALDLKTSLIEEQMIALKIIRNELARLIEKLDFDKFIQDQLSKESISTVTQVVKTISETINQPALSRKYFDYLTSHAYSIHKSQLNLRINTRKANSVAAYASKPEVNPEKIDIVQQSDNRTRSLVQTEVEKDKQLEINLRSEENENAQDDLKSRNQLSNEVTSEFIVNVIDIIEHTNWLKPKIGGVTIKFQNAGQLQEKQVAKHVAEIYKLAITTEAKTNPLNVFNKIALIGAHASHDKPFSFFGFRKRDPKAQAFYDQFAAAYVDKRDTLKRGAEQDQANSNKKPRICS